MLPCGTPQVTGFEFDRWSLTRHFWVRSVRYDLNHSKPFPGGINNGHFIGVPFLSFGDEVLRGEFSSGESCENNREGLSWSLKNELS